MTEIHFKSKGLLIFYFVGSNIEKIEKHGSCCEIRSFHELSVKKLAKNIILL